MAAGKNRKSTANTVLPPPPATIDKPRRQLGPCMGAPGPHDFVVRANVVRRPTPSAATAFRSQGLGLPVNRSTTSWFLVR
jgi:hypothetical protein